MNEPYYKTLVQSPQVMRSLFLRGVWGWRPVDRPIKTGNRYECKTTGYHKTIKPRGGR